MSKVLIVAGGTGGHIFPGLALARALQARGQSVAWLGTRAGLENKILQNEVPLYYLNASGFRGKGVIKKIISLYDAVIATVQAIQFIRRFKPSVVVAMGGYTAGPGGLAAWLLRIPLVIHEQNAIAGFTNRCLSKFATITLQAFPNTFSASTLAKTVGNPVREDLCLLRDPKTRFAQRSDVFRLLILGGSRGAHDINQTVILTMKNFSMKSNIELWHQTGEKDFDHVKIAYNNCGVKAQVVPFIREMAQAYAWADCVVSRAGALTVSEIAVVGLPSILIPFPYAVDNHQWYNAEWLVKAGAAVRIAQQDFTEEVFNQLMIENIQHRDQLLTMAENAWHLAKRDALDAVTTEVMKLC